MNELRDLARTLLSRRHGRRSCIGWEDGRRGARPAFVTDAGRRRQAHLRHPLRAQPGDLPQPAPPADHARSARPPLVVKGCDAKAVAGLLREAQLTRDDVVLIGVRCGGVLEEARAAEAAPLTAETVAPRCYGCDNREPVALRPPRRRARSPSRPSRPRPSTSASPRSTPCRSSRALGLLDGAVRASASAATPAARSARCASASAASPTRRCRSGSRPRRTRAATSPGTSTRALHLAGRCVGCGECERFCPVGIPLSLAQPQAAADRAPSASTTCVSDDPAAPAPIGDFRLDDEQEFIK